MDVQKLMDTQKGIVDLHTSARLLEPGPQYILVIGLVCIGLLAVWLKWGRKK